MKIVVPVLSLVASNGLIDQAATRRYAQLMAEASDYTFIVNGGLGLESY